jgi:hypothetical protein
MKLVVYENDGEVLICAKKDEQDLLREYFKLGGRDVDEYDRSVFSDVVQISPRMHVHGDYPITDK